MSNTNIPEEYLHCFNVTDEFGEVEPMELESSQVPDVAEVVGYEWHQWQPGQEEPAQTVEEQLGIKSLIRFRDFKQWKVEEYITLKEEEKVEVAVPSQQNNSKSKTAVNKVRGSYRSYSPQQIQELIDLVIMTGMSARQAGLSLGIVVRTAQHYVKKYKDDEEKRVPVPRLNDGRSFGNNQKLFEQHTDFLCQIFDAKADLTLWEARDKLLETFPDIGSITLSALHKHLANKASLTLKKLDKIVAPRDSETTIQIRHDRVLEWMNDPNLDWMSTCVFIDEAGFNLHLRRNFGRSARGKPARVVVPANRGVSVTIVGAICELGIIDLSIKRPQTQVKKLAASKKRKLRDGEAEDYVKLRSRVGTRTEHFLHFLSGVLDELDFHGFKGRYIVMDNASIHKSMEVAKIIEDRGYKVVYLPPYSPFLNPIEEFWSKVKAGVKRDTLTMTSNLSHRIIESSKKVTPNDCQGWIRHSYSFFERCLNRERML